MICFNMEFLTKYFFFKIFAYPPTSQLEKLILVQWLVTHGEYTSFEYTPLFSALTI
jgi:hypothetical protein